MVIAYVDNRDEVWKKTFIDYCTKNNIRNKIAELHTERFEDIGLINYQLKLINKHMPFINKIFLLLSNKEQAPKDLPSNVVVVLHEQFIPYRFRPTFNSCTIEMFLWNITELSEYFIYANDDMLPFRDMKPSDFFSENGKVKINWYQQDIRDLGSMFRYQCLNSYQDVCKVLHMPIDKFHYIRPEHSFTPLVKSHCLEIFMKLKDNAFEHIRAFRTFYQYNQYIYPIYEHFRYGDMPSELDFLYTQLNEDIDLDHDIVCLNIVPQNKKKEIIKELEKRI